MIFTPEQVALLMRPARGYTQAALLLRDIQLRIDQKTGKCIIPDILLKTLDSLLKSRPEVLKKAEASYLDRLEVVRTVLVSHTDGRLFHRGGPFFPQGKP